MAIVGKAVSAGGGKSKPKFEYSGEYNVREDGVVELLTSGMLYFPKAQTIDIFCVGGGGAGGYSTRSNTGYSGGGGGYTATLLQTQVSGSYEITIGNGGVEGDGGNTSFGGLLVANGGKAAVREYQGIAGNGGSGGGGGGTRSPYNTAIAGDGGKDGASGVDGSLANGGTGQGTITREFAEIGGKLYAGGGGGGYYTYNTTNPGNSGAGGDGGGGAGAVAAPDTLKPYVKDAENGAANTGGGGGGGARYGGTSTPNDHPGGSGGSGIVCIRVHRK